MTERKREDCAVFLLRRKLPRWKRKPDDVVVLPKFARVLKAYTAGDFRASPAPARELKRGEVTAAMPNWAQSAQANAAVFDKIPA